MKKMHNEEWSRPISLRHMAAIWK